MAAAAAAGAPIAPVMSPPIPLDLRRDLVDPTTPWMVRQALFDRLEPPSSPDIKYKKVQLSPEDPEWRVVWKFFHHRKPLRYGIKNIAFVYNHSLRKKFELELTDLKTRTENPFFSPTWDQEARPDQRADVIARWRACADIFSDFLTRETDGRTTNFRNTRVRVLPLWHGTSQAVCHSICNQGFTYFGKNVIPGGANGDPLSTDDGYFGSGIYLTNSARYAADIYAKGGALMLAWASMDEPFPVVGGPQIVVSGPQRRGIPQPVVISHQEDMAVLRGQNAYKKYTAHYIPVAPTDPLDDFCAEYHPIQIRQEPVCDEYVVFQSARVLPQFQVELEVEFPDLVIPPRFVSDMIPYLKRTLQNSQVDGDLKLRNFLNSSLALLMRLRPDDDLPPQLTLLYGQLGGLLTANGEVVQAVRDLVTQREDAIPNLAPTTAAQPAVGPVPVSAAAAAAVVVAQPAAGPEPVVRPLSAMAFGKAAWAAHVGDIGEDIPLPQDIEETLAKPCPFWEGKTVGETHLLVLVPEKVNGQPLTLSSLREYVKQPLSVPQAPSLRIRLGQYQDVPTKSHWMLFTKSVIEETRGKPEAVQQTILQTYSQKVGRVYSMPPVLDATVGMLMEYLRTGVCPYGSDPWKYTRCQENYSRAPLWYLEVGGFNKNVLTIDSDGGNNSRGVAGYCRL